MKKLIINIKNTEFLQGINLKFLSLLFVFFIGSSVVYAQKKNTKSKIKNIAKHKVVTASSARIANPVKNIVDGNNDNSWLPTEMGGQWVIIDLGQEYDISRIKLYPSADAINGQYTSNEIFESSDLINWKSIFKYESNGVDNGAIRELNCSPISRNIRGIKVVTPIAYSVLAGWNEIEVFGYASDIQKYQNVNNSPNNKIAEKEVEHNFGSFTDSRDGKVYKTINIGTQTWMAENLAFKPENGYWAYNNNQSYVTGSNYGYLYNKTASQYVCPTGWHLPSDSEWKKLTDYLGGADIAGGKLKFSKGWNEPNTNATNESGFSGLPSGQHTFNFNMFFGSNTDVFSLAGESGCWWTASWNERWGSGWQDIIAAWRLTYNSSSITRESFYMDINCPYDFSVRCVKD
jgi:uncharacterized protein (TIGR02145 family)